MKIMKMFLFIICTALLLAPLTGCGSKGNSGDAYYYSQRDPWAYDRYYRSRVHHHHYRHYNRPNRPNRPSRPPNRPRPRPVQLPR